MATATKKAPAKKAAATKPEGATGAEVREWAAKKGLTAGLRGRLSMTVIEAYNKAHPKRKYVVTEARTSEVARKAAAAAKAAKKVAAKKAPAKRASTKKAAAKAPAAKA